MPLEYQRKTNLLDHDDFSRLAGGGSRIGNISGCSAHSLVKVHGTSAATKRDESQILLCVLGLVRAGSIPLILTITEVRMIIVRVSSEHW